MKNYYRLFAALTLLLFTVQIKAEIKLPAVIGSHMVLQQQTNAALWGKAAENKTVTVTTSWDKKTYKSRSDANGNWKVQVATPSAGGPYSINISDGKGVTLENIMIGEVWVCSGQSNMQMIMQGYFNQPVLGANEAIATSANEQIRLFSVERNHSLEPLDDFKGQWLECLPGNVANFSATAYFFGKMVQEALGVPVGLICSSWGGTRIEPWMSANGIKPFDWVKIKEDATPETINQGTPTALFNAMIAPMTRYAIRGAIWYQGESNRNEPDRYEKLIPGMIQSWRDAWGIGDFPFYYVQIAPYHYGMTGTSSAYLREAQLNASNALPNIGMACLMDAGEAYCIHPSNKKAAGDRLAYLALAKTYGIEGVEFSGPVLKEVIIEGSIVKLTFDHAKNGLTTFGKPLENFYLSGNNQRFVPAQASITREGITLCSPMVDKPVAVRYAFDDFVVGELYNNEGLPASSFRTDTW